MSILLGISWPLDTISHLPLWLFLVVIKCPVHSLGIIISQCGFLGNILCVSPLSCFIWPCVIHLGVRSLQVWVGGGFKWNGHLPVCVIVAPCQKVLPQFSGIDFVVEMVVRHSVILDNRKLSFLFYTGGICRPIYVVAVILNKLFASS